MAEATTTYEVVARVGDDVNVVTTEYIPTVADVCRLSNLDIRRAVPIISDRVADWLTHLVPGARVEFLV